LVLRVEFRLTADDDMIGDRIEVNIAGGLDIRHAHGVHPAEVQDR
jgi:hypothetical protein